MSLWRLIKKRTVAGFCRRERSAIMDLRVSDYTKGGYTPKYRKCRDSTRGKMNDKVAVSRHGHRPSGRVTWLLLFKGLRNNSSEAKTSKWKKFLVGIKTIATKQQ